MEETRQAIRAGDKTFAAALAKLERDAQTNLHTGPFSVMEKQILPPSGDKHDFISQAPYYWPNTNSPDGLPYIRRDGERNPEIYEISDRRNLGKLIGAVETLALAIISPLMKFTPKRPRASCASGFLTRLPG